MFFQKVKSEGIAHLSYFIGQGSEAAVIDPRRDIDIYLDIARKNEMNITHVFETHRNEDYAIGSQELAAATGAKIFHGGQLMFRYGLEAKDGQEFRLGELRIFALHTPGHTPESFSYVLHEPSAGNHPVMVFCGDALLVGDVGRTDFYGTEARERLATELHDSITRKILPLGPGTILCPAHGAGSVCATEIVEREESTLGIEMATNHMLKISRAEFIEAKRRENLELSPIFKRMEAINLEGARVLGRLPIPPALTPKELKHAIVKGGFLLDIRSPYSFAGAFIPGAINLHLNFVPVYAGYVVPHDRAVLVVAESTDHVDTFVRYMVRQGHDGFAGYLRAGMDQWSKGGHELASMDMVTAKDLNGRLKKGEEMFLTDVRDRKESAQGIIEGAKLIHLGEVHARMAEIPKNKTVVTYCGSGFRGSCAASMLMRNGYTKVENLHGGFNAWKAGGFPIVR